MAAESGGSGVVSSIVIASATGFLPEAVVSYGEKILSVFLLAVVAELGRRLVTFLTKGKKS